MSPQASSRARRRAHDALGTRRASRWRPRPRMSQPLSASSFAASILPRPARAGRGRIEAAKLDAERGCDILGRGLQRLALRVPSASWARRRARELACGLKHPSLVSPSRPRCSASPSRPRPRMPQPRIELGSRKSLSRHSGQASGASASRNPETTPTPATVVCPFFWIPDKRYALSGMTDGGCYAAFPDDQGWVLCGLPGPRQRSHRFTPQATFARSRLCTSLRPGRREHDENVSAYSAALRSLRFGSGIPGRIFNRSVAG